MWSVLLRTDGRDIRAASKEHSLHSSVLCFSQVPEKVSLWFLPILWDIMSGLPDAAKYKGLGAWQLWVRRWGMGRASPEALVTCLPGAHDPYLPPT